MSEIDDLFGEYADPWRKKRLKEMSGKQKSPGETAQHRAERRTFVRIVAATGLGTAVMTGRLGNAGSIKNEKGGRCWTQQRSM